MQSESRQTKALLTVIGAACLLLTSFVHLVDGGITDNLGLRSLYQAINSAGGAQSFFTKSRIVPPKRIVIISVNAAVHNQYAMNRTRQRPSVSETMLAMSELQLARYNATTLNLLRQSLQQWTQELSSETGKISSWFIDLDFNDVQSDTLRKRLNEIPTALTLPDADIDLLIATGEQLLNEDPVFGDLMNDIHKP